MKENDQLIMLGLKLTEQDDRFTIGIHVSHIDLTVSNKEYWSCEENIQGMETLCMSLPCTEFGTH